jgi:hypothetical protein
MIMQPTYLIKLVMIEKTVALYERLSSTMAPVMQ